MNRLAYKFGANSESPSTFLQFKANRDLLKLAYRLNLLDIYSGEFTKDDKNQTSLSDSTVPDIIAKNDPEGYNVREQGRKEEDVLAS